MKKLTDLEPAEVSLVSRGAIRKKFLIFKSQNKQGDKMKSKLINSISKLNPKLISKIENVFKDFKAQENNDQEEQAKTALKAVIRILMPQRELIPLDLVMRTLEQSVYAEEEGENSDSDKDEQGDSEMMNKEDKKDPKKDKEEEMEKMKKSSNKDLSLEEERDEELDDDVEKAKASKEEDEEEVEKLGKPLYPEAKMKMKADKEKDSVDKSEIFKSDGSLRLDGVSEGVRNQIEAIFKSERERVSKAETELKQEREERINKEFIAKAEGFKNLACDKAALAQDLKAIHKANPELLARLENVLKAADAQLGGGELLKELGSSHSNAVSGADSWDKIEKSAERYIAKSGEKMSREMAVEAYLKTSEGSEMYAAYKGNRKDGI